MLLTNVDVDEQGTCIPCMVICTLGMGQNGSPPESLMEINLPSASVLNTSISSEE